MHDLIHVVALVLGGDKTVEPAAAAGPGPAEGAKHVA